MNVVEFYYPEEIAAFEREFVEAQRAAYMETCIEDDEIAERMGTSRNTVISQVVAAMAQLDAALEPA